MKKVLFLLIMLISFVACTKNNGITSDSVEYFTNITYEVTSTGAVLTPNINYGDLKYSNSSYPDSLIWNVITVSSAVLPWSETVSTCVGHPVKIGAIVAGNNRTMTFNIYNNKKLVATKTFESNGFLWGGNIEYNIPKPQ